MDNDRELFIHWAAEEFVAAGRVEAGDERLVHRRQAQFYIDICRSLRELPPSYAAHPWNGALGHIVLRAITERHDEEGDVAGQDPSLPAPPAQHERRR